ncbi:MAG TPA: indolepyruvate ferredoxin oxidoreductase subunit alpha [Chitinispirillaceae bacterium]|nr:indolepyruvate ferredoxin oxidoreductase subunit alpha [Chitinispirillaceae bacterium]
MKRLMLGNEAVSRGAYEAGVTVATAYPGTPSTEITEYLSSYPEIDSEWSVNEKVALEIGIGASIAGARALVCMKHVGLNVAMDPLMSISYPGVNGGLVIVVADDPGQHSSQNEQDTRYFGIAAKIPVLEPSDSQECKDFVIKAFELSEQFDTPVILRLSTRVSHSQSVVELGERQQISLKDFQSTEGKYIVAPGYARKRRVVAEKRLEELHGFAETTDLNVVHESDGPVGVITSGIAFQYAREALPDAGFLKLGLSYPLPRKKIEEFASKFEKLYVVEELEPIFETLIKSWGVKVIGKEKLPTIGELDVSTIREALTGRRLSETPLSLGYQLPQRPPVLCPGCHHRGPFYVLKKLKLRVSGDIGCYTLAAFPPFSSMHTSICMGASIGMAFGFEKARGKSFAGESVAVIGDSTFWHSGVTGLIDVVYNKGFTTVIILDNAVTAMTGHQENPSTGRTLHGTETVQLDFEALARSIGIRRVTNVDAYDLDALERVIREEVAAKEPSVIITRKPCILKKGTVSIRKEPCEVQIEKCKACRKCIALGCPAIYWKENKAFIDSTLCTGCELCKSVCRFGAITSK